MRLSALSAENLMLKRGGSVNPANFSTEIFELLSIPAFDKGKPDIAKGCDIGSSKSCVEPNDVLLSKIVPHIRRCWVVPQKSKYRQIASGEWIIFRDERFYPDYLKYFLTSNIFHRQFMETVAGVGGSLVRARPSAVERIEIPLPPLAEQKHIAAILDKADSLRRKNQQAIQLADQFLRAVFLDMFGDPVTNSKGTELIPITECFHITTGRLNSNAAIEGGKYPFFTCAKDIFAIDDYAFDQEALLLAGNNAQAIYDVKHYKGKFNAYQRTYVLTLKKLDYSYPFYKFALEYQLENLKRVSKGSSTKYITMEIMNRTMLPVPSSKKQKEFVSYFEKYEKINEMNIKSTQLCDTCFSSLSQKAFAGEL